MGGEIPLVSTALNIVGSLMSGPQKMPSNDNAAAMRAEREAQEEAQRKREADERRRERDKVQEARDIEKKRKASALSGKTTLVNGGAGLLTEPEVKKSGLKEKFGE